jgi:hypothetical protein
MTRRYYADHSQGTRGGRAHAYIVDERALVELGLLSGNVGQMLSFVHLVPALLQTSVDEFHRNYAFSEVKA